MFRRTRIERFFVFHAHQSIRCLDDIRFRQKCLELASRRSGVRPYRACLHGNQLFPLKFTSRVRRHVDVISSAIVCIPREERRRGLEIFRLIRIENIV